MRTILLHRSGFAGSEAVAGNSAPIASDDTLDAIEGLVTPVDFSTLVTDPDDDLVFLSGNPTATHGTISNVSLLAMTADYTAPALSVSSTDTISYSATDGQAISSGNIAVTVLEASVTISGATTVNSLLTAETDLEGALFQWNRNGSPISGATAQSYTLTAADDLTSVTVTVTADEFVQTSAPVSVTYAAPVWTVQPTFSPASVGIAETITINEGTVTPAATITVEVFELDDVDVSDDLDGTSYSPPEEGLLEAQLRATNSGGTVLSDTFAATVVFVRDVPNAFSLGSDRMVDPGATTNFDPVTVSGLGSGVSVVASIEGAQFRVLDGATVLRALGASNYSVQNGYTIEVVHTASSSYDVATNVRLSIGSVSDVAAVTTAPLSVEVDGDFLVFDYGDLTSVITFDRDGDTANIHTADLTEQADMENGPVYDEVDPPTFTRVADNLIGNPGFWYFFDEDKELTTEIVDAADAVLESSTNDLNNLTYAIVGGEDFPITFRVTATHRANGELISRVVEFDYDPADSPPVADDHTVTAIVKPFTVPPPEAADHTITAVVQPLGTVVPEGADHTRTAIVLPGA